MLAEPTIPPMMRSPYSNQIPDFVVVGPDTAAKGLGGIEALGFWGRNQTRTRFFLRYRKLHVNKQISLRIRLTYQIRTQFRLFYLERKNLH